MSAWPPTLQELKDDLGKELDDSRDNAQLTTVLNAAIELVEYYRSASYNFTADPLSDLPEPPLRVRMGTLRLAGRWHRRRRSPDGLIEMKELGSSIVPSFDPDIDRMLSLGRFAEPMVA